MDDVTAESDNGNGEVAVRRRPVMVFEGAKLRWVYKPKTPITLAELAQVMEFLLFSQGVGMRMVPPGLLDEFWANHMESGAKRHFLVVSKGTVYVPQDSRLAIDPRDKFERGA